MDGGRFSNLDGAGQLLDSMLSAADSLIDSEYWKLTGTQLLDVGRGMETLARKVRAAQIRLVDELNQQGVAATKAVPSTAKLVSQAFAISTGEAAARVAAAKATLPQDLPGGGEQPPLRPVLGRAITDGTVDGDSVRTVLGTLRRLPETLDPAVVQQAEQTLVDYARTTPPDQFRKIAAHLGYVLDPDGPEPDPEPARSKVEFTLGNRSAATGLTNISGWLDDLGVATLQAVIDPLSAPKPEVDGVKDQRAAATRRAHALIEALDFVLTHGDTVLPDTGGERPHVTVTLDWNHLEDKAGAATLDTGYPLTPGALRRLLCDAAVLPAVLGGESRVLDLGRTQRLFSPTIRKALALRDKGCAWPGCDRPPAWCEAHHANWWGRDLGATSYDNGVLLCRHHHAQIHLGDWTIQIAHDGVPEFQPPPWIDPHRTPRRNTLHHLSPVRRT